MEKNAKILLAVARQKEIYGESDISGCFLWFGGRVSRICPGFVPGHFRLMPQTKETQQQKSSKDS